MSPLMSEEKMDAMSSGDECDSGLMYTEMLEYICDVSQSHPSINIREAHYKIRVCNKQSQAEWK